MLNEFQTDIRTTLSCSRFRPGIEKNNSTFKPRLKLLPPSKNFRIEEDGKKREIKKKKRQASSLTDRIIEEIGFVFDRGDCSRLFKLHHHTKITLYVTMECSTDGEHIAIASNIRDRFASYGWTCNILSSRAIENRYPSTNLCYQSRVTDKSNTRVTIKLVKASGV